MEMNNSKIINLYAHRKDQFHYLDKILDQFEFPDEAAKRRFKEKTIPLITAARTVSATLVFDDLPNLELKDRQKLENWAANQARDFISEITVQVYFKILVWSALLHLREAESLKTLDN
jgi:hypothetical protein